MSKKLLSLALTLVMSLSLCVPAFAAPKNTTSKSAKDCATTPVYVTNFKPEEIRAQLLALGCTENQIEYLFALEKRVQATPTRGVSNLLSSGNIGFPSNPKEGDQYTKTYRISKDALLAAKQTEVGICEALIAGDVPLGVAVAICGGVWTYLISHKNFSYLVIQTTYVYGETDEGTLDWNTGYTSFSFI